MKWHPFAEKFPLMVGVDGEQFGASIAKTKGPEIKVLYRIVNGKKEYVDGRNRVHFSDQLGLPWKEEEVKLSDDEVIDFIIRRNVRRRHLPPTLRQEIVSELRTNGHSTRAIAETVGVSQSTVAKDIKAADSGEYKNSPDIKITGKDGKSYKPVSKNTKKKPPKNGETPKLPKGVANALADTWHGDCARMLSKMRSQCKAAFSWSVYLDPAILDHLKLAEDCFLTAMPRIVCPDCEGQKIVDKKSCLTCRQGGYIASQVI